MPASVGSEAGFSFRKTDEGGSGQQKAPIELDRFGDPNPAVNFDTDPRITAQELRLADRKKVVTMKFASNRECLSQFTGSGTEAANVGNSPAPHHRLAAAGRFQGANQYEPVRLATLNEKIQQPVDPVIQIDIERSSGIYFDEFSSAAAQEGMTCLVAVFSVRLGFDD